MVILGRPPGVLRVEPDAVGQTATVVYDAEVTTFEDLAGWVAIAAIAAGRESTADHRCPTERLAVQAPVTLWVLSGHGARRDGA